MRVTNRRIEDRSRAPRRTGILQTLGLTALIVLALGRFASAQYTMPEHDLATRKLNMDYAHYHRPALDYAARRRMEKGRLRRDTERAETLARKLEQLADQVEDIEAKLLELDHATGRERHDLETRLGPLWAEIEEIERHLDELRRGQVKGRPRREPREPGPGELDRQLHELTRHRDALVERAHHKQAELNELAEHAEQREHEVHAELREIREKIDKLMRQREELAKRAHHHEMELEELREHTERRRNEVRAELHDIHEQMKGIEARLAHLEHERRERRRHMLAESRQRIEKLTAHLHELHERANEIQRALEKLGAEDAEAHRLRAALAETREQIRHIERRLHGAPRPSKHRPRHRPMGPPPGLEGSCVELMGQLEAARAEIEEVKEAEGGVIEALRLEVKALREVTQATSEQLERLYMRDHPSTVGSAGHYCYWH